MALFIPLKSSQFANGSEFYEICDEYDSSVTGFLGDFEYFGYMNSNGKWIIQQHQITTGTYRYKNGTTGYAAAFLAATTGLSSGYDYINTLKNTTP